MNVNFMISLILLISPFLNIVNGLNCYSCSACNPGTNGVTITCNAGETCFVGQSSNSKVDQGCIANLGTILNSYVNLRGCGSSNLCNTNTYSSQDSNSNSYSYTYRSNSNKIRIARPVLGFSCLLLFGLIKNFLS